jgi:ABC-type polysaccharide/polyol phosphate export permease
MFEVQVRRSRTRSAFVLLDLIYHSIVRDVRKNHRNAFIGLFLNILQGVIFVITFYAMFAMLGMRGAALRGDFLLYIMSGVFLFMTHNKALAAVMAAEGPTSPMMQHSPMNTVISITSAALSSLYLQILTLVVVLLFYQVAYKPLVIEHPVGAFGMLLAAWFSGIGIGIIFLSLKPWAPDVITVISSLYQRVNMIASGKMFVANALPSAMLAMFDWNPLFHSIDQARGYVFLHYNPHFTSGMYPIYFGTALLVLGMMGEFYTRKHASLSWGAGR